MTALQLRGSNTKEKKNIKILYGDLRFLFYLIALYGVQPFHK